MSSAGAAPRAAVSVSSARAEASRRNGAKSRGPKTPEGKARSSKNALKHGLRAHKYVVLPQEDAAEFAEFQAALIEELAPVGALQAVLARRIAIAAWRLARADRMEADVLDERGYGNASPGLALMRDGNGTRSFETLMRYRNAAMAEFMRALRTLKALQAERAPDQPVVTNPAPRSRAMKPDGRVAGPPVTERARRLAPPRPDEPKKPPRNHDLDSGKGPIAAIRPASGPRDGAHVCPEPCDPRVAHSAHP